MSDVQSDAVPAQEPAQEVAAPEAAAPEAAAPEAAAPAQPHPAEPLLQRIEELTQTVEATVMEDIRALVGFIRSVL